MKLRSGRKVFGQIFVLRFLSMVHPKTIAKYGADDFGQFCFILYVNFNFGLMVRGLSQRPNLTEGPAATRGFRRSTKEEEVEFYLMALKVH
jgi:hypothetical protein